MWPLVKNIWEDKGFERRKKGGEMVVITVVNLRQMIDSCLWLLRTPSTRKKILSPHRRRSSFHVLYHKVPNQKEQWVQEVSKGLIMLTVWGN